MDNYAEKANFEHRGRKRQKEKFLVPVFPGNIQFNETIENGIKYLLQALLLREEESGLRGGNSFDRRNEPRDNELLRKLRDSLAKFPPFE